MGEAADLADVLGEPLDQNVGGKTAEALSEGLDLHTVGDLLDHFPRRYVERGELTRLDELVPGELVTIQAEVVKVSGRQIRHKLHKLDVIVSDGRGTLTITFFNQRLAGTSNSCPGQATFSPARSRSSASTGSGS